jgi:hypothetical protein
VNGSRDSVGSYDIDPGAFPLEALSPVMRDIAESAADVYQMPSAMPAMAALAVQAGALGKTYEVDGAVNAQRSFGNLYVFAAAPRGGGKSTVARVLAGPLLAANEQLEIEFRRHKIRVETEAAILEKQIDGLLRSVSKSPGEDLSLTKALETKQIRLAEIAPNGLPIETPTLVEGNCTSEALAVSLRAGDQALLSFSPEAGELLRVALGKYNKAEQGDFDLLLSGWSSETSLRKRVSSGRNSLAPTLSALWFVQPFMLQELVGNEEAFERGLTARPLIFDSKIELAYDDGVVRTISNSAVDAWRYHIQRVVKGRPSKAVSFPVRCSPEAREVFRLFHNESIDLRRGTCADIEGELSRWRENAIRVALNLWLGDGRGGDITSEQADRAVTIVKWCGRSYLAILNQGRVARRLTRVHELGSLLLETPEQTVTLRDLANRHGYCHDEVRALASEFPDKLTVVTKPPGAQGGRPSEMLTRAESASAFRR